MRAAATTEPITARAMRPPLMLVPPSEAPSDGDPTAEAVDGDDADELDRNHVVATTAAVVIEETFCALAPFAVAVTSTAFVVEVVWFAVAAAVAVTFAAHCRVDPPIADCPLEPHGLVTPPVVAATVAEVWRAAAVDATEVATAAAGAVLDDGAVTALEPTPLIAVATEVAVADVKLLTLAAVVPAPAAASLLAWLALPLPPVSADAAVKLLLVSKPLVDSSVVALPAAVVPP